MKLSMSSGHKLNSWLKIAGGLVVMITCLFSAPSRAVECGFSKTFTDNISIPVVGSGISTAGEDIPIGKVLYSQTYTVAPYRETKFSCTIKDTEIENGPISMNVYTRIEVVSTPSGPALKSGGKDIFPTNIPGIGVIFTILSNRLDSSFPSTWENTTPLGFGTLTQGLGQFSQVKIEFIKTGPIAPGVQQIQGAALPSFQVVSGSNSPSVMSNVFINLNFTGTTTVHTKTCQLATSDIEVNLGSHEVNMFDSPGKSTEWKDFDIVLQGCPPFYGYGNYKFKEASGISVGSNTDNVVSIVFKSANGTVEGNPLLAKLDGGVNAATGVGIELSQRDISGSIPMDGSDGFKLLNLTKEDNATYKIPLKARYVQTDSTVKAGPANGSVIFTITYL
ncbi:fimbrial protein [Klebsiella aerogenes]|uniref:fimbrial protein n=1 Tax=Klebsiella aerogenes TaxID=548 RepID=UPI0025512385|nr:fimbrial protein [Klebsiella aerogenes]MDK6932428.1 fimbrial protein [Klebsiella aerogenes]